jgi:hypothetical protein
MNQELSSKLFFPKISYGCKIIFSKTGLNKKFSSKIFLSAIFYGVKIISSGAGLNQKFSKFWPNFFYGC